MNSRRRRRDRYYRRLQEAAYWNISLAEYDAAIARYHKEVSGGDESASLFWELWGTTKDKPDVFGREVKWKVEES